MDTLTAARVLSVVSSGTFAGYTWALSDAAVPGMLDAAEAALCRQWRYQYLRGFYASVLATPINIIAWTYLAYHTPPTLATQLFITAAVTTGSGTAFAWTALRGVNGALSIRCAKVAGPGDRPDHISLTYSRGEAWARNMEQRYSTRELVYSWKRLNLMRAGILFLGTAVGALGLALSS